jgi:PAS domain S-box-containing protein
MKNVEIQQARGVSNMSMRLPSASAIERLPWAVRGLLGLFTAGFAVGLTYTIGPLRAFPLLLAFPTVVLSSWFLGMWGGVACAVADAVLVDAFLTRTQFQFSIGYAREELRLAVFLTISILLGWAIRRLADQRAELRNRELQQRLTLADAERQLAEEQAHASEALRQRNDELQLALRVHGMGLWSWDVERGTIDWTDEVYRLLGREPGSMTPSIDAWFNSIHPEDITYVRDSTAQDLESRCEFYKQFRVIWPDGSLRWVESHSTCQRDREGRATRLIGVLADVTHRKQAEEAMLRAEKLAVAGRLAASVAHEINNPLEAVANLLFLISLTENVGDAQAHARKALDELMRISLITQSTLKFHRQAGSPKITLLSEVVESVLVLFRGRLLKSEITVEVRSNNEVAIACMPSEAQQIFSNVVSNAIEATPRGGKLVIRLRPSRDWRDPRIQGMRVTFVDSGMGMGRPTMRLIFEPFFTTKTDTGTGLGMWVVAQLVERHRGHVRVWSTQLTGASGTAFSVFLPIGLPMEVNNAAVVSNAESGRELITDRS